MSLTSNLANENSAVSVFFREKFDFYPTFGINEQLKKHKAIVPSIQKDYKWSNAGHVIEYLANLHVGVKLIDLFPMKHYQVQDTFYSYAITFYKLKGFSDFKELVCILYYLSQVEEELRTGRRLNKIKEPGEVFIKDMEALFENIKKSEYFNDKKTFKYNPMFSLSSFIKGADADFIKTVGKENYLMDMKTTKYAKITEGMLNQLMGYVLLDAFNQHNLDGVGIYMPRQDVSVKWKINDLIENCSLFKNIEEARMDFAKVIGASSLLRRISESQFSDQMFADFDQPH